MLLRNLCFILSMNLIQGLTKPVRKRVEVPNEFLTRSLQAGETVIGEYDYFYMDKQMYSSDVRTSHH